MIARLREEGPAALTVLMVLAVGVILTCCFGAILGGCAEVRTPADASRPSDGALVQGCGTLRNTLETVGPECPWRDWGCPFEGPVEPAVVRACNEALYAVSPMGCPALEATLTSCSTTPAP